MSLQFDIYNPVGILIGRANSHSSQLDSLCGSCTLPILNTILVPIGEISFQYLIVKPFSHPNMSKVLKYTFWKSIAVIGHRGGGAEQYSKIGKYRRSHIRENTILSFITAASLGAQYVEFDVQLSKDQIPVIFHDFVIPIHSNNEDNIKIPINNITLEQFKKLYVPNNKRKLSNTSSLSYPNQIIRSKSLENIRTENGNDQPFVKSIESHNQQNNIKDSYATLEECFRNIPPETGFNIELKYPRDLPRIADELGLKVYERNQFVDTILKIVFELAGERKIMFSCFEPDVCIMLRNKQPRYPVFFLTAGGCGREACDIRCSSIQQAIRFAKANNLMGIVSNAKPIIQCPELIQTVKRSGLMLCTYGKENNQTENVDLQERLGVDAVIVDHVAYVAKHLSSI
jgi:glycerophosphodiester phosphodiesterase